MTASCYSIGELLLDEGVREVRRDGCLIHLPPLSFDLLLALARHAPNLVTISELEGEVWPELVVSPATIAKRVALLREALGDKAEDPTYIAVVRGHGYRLLVPVCQITSTIPPGTSTPMASPPRWLRPSLAALAIFVLLAVVVVSTIQRNSEIDEASDTSIAANNAHGILSPESSIEAWPGLSVAVLPFVSMSDTANDQHIADGIAEEIINRLAAVEPIKVVARTSSFAFRGRQDNIETIARILHVNYIVEGSVQFDRDTIRVTVQMIDARSGYHVWSKKFDRPFSDIFAIQDDIAASVASASDLALGKSVRTVTDHPMTNSAEAYALYLRGRGLLHERLELGLSAVDESISAFRAATQVDPDFPDAWAGLSAALWLRPGYDGDRNRAEYDELVESAALKALEFDVGNSEANAVLGSVYWRTGSFPQSKKYFDKALESPVANTNARLWAGILMESVGYIDRSYALYEEANRLDPLNQSVITFLSNSLVTRGEFDKALQLITSQASHEWRELHRGRIALEMGRVDEARELLSNLSLPIGVLPAPHVEHAINSVESQENMLSAEGAILGAVRSGNMSKEVAYQLLWLMGSAALFEVSDDVPTGVLSLHIATKAWSSQTAAFRQDQRFQQWAFDAGLVEFWNASSWPQRCQPISDISFQCW